MTCEPVDVATIEIMLGGVFLLTGTLDRLFLFFLDLPSLDASASSPLDNLRFFDGGADSTAISTEDSVFSVANGFCAAPSVASDDPLEADTGAEHFHDESNAPVSRLKESMLAPLAARITLPQRARH
jgi:hypothetical protein